MTEQRRREIRAELARRMGITLEKRWQHATDPTWCLYDVRLPDGTYLGSHCGSIEEAASKLPDPFTSAAAKDQLLKFVAAQPARVRLDFEHKLYLLILEGRNDDRFSLSPLDFMTASPEVVTLAAAKALGIETE